MPRCIIIKLLKTKDKRKFLKVAREKWHLPGENNSNDRSSRQKSRRSEESITTFQVLEEKNGPSWILYPTKISFRNEEEIKTFSDKKTNRICFQQTYLKRMTTEIVLSKEMTKEGILEQEKQENSVKIWVNTKDFPFLLSFLSCGWQPKIITLSAVVWKYMEEIFKTIILYTGEGKLGT